MFWIVAAACGGFFIGSFVFYLIGAAKGYVCAVRHLTAIGALALQNAEAAQAQRQPQVTVLSPITRTN